MDTCWLCETVKSQHHSKDHEFSSKAEALARIEFTLEIRDLIDKMDQYNHQEVKLESAMPIHLPGYGKSILN